MKSFIAYGVAMLISISTAHADISGPCAPKRTNYLASETSTQTASVAFIEVANSEVFFRQGGTSPGCVIVQFYAATAVKDNVLYVRAVLNDLSSVTPAQAAFGGAAFYTGNLFYGANSMAFVFPSVSPGKHIAYMQMKTLNGDNVAEIDQHTILVMHN